jgi:hypothetical protein
MFSSRTLWFFFVTFAAAQGVIFFGITLAPGFFTEIIGIPIKQAIVFIFPMVGIGVLLGMYFIQKTRMRELYLISFGNSIVGITLVFFGLLIKTQLFPSWLIVFLSVPFLIFLGSGMIVIMVASRTSIQTKVPSAHQGIVFGANIILASLIATIMSILAVIFEVVFGYLGTFVLGGTALIMVGGLLGYLGKRWKY